MRHRVCAPARGEVRAARFGALRIPVRGFCIPCGLWLRVDVDARGESGYDLVSRFADANLAGVVHR